MPDYRLCLLDESGGVRAASEFAAPDDEVALRLSEDAASGQAAELWRGEVLVQRIPGRPPA